MAKKGKTVKKGRATHELEIYEKILENVQEDIMLLDRDFKILWANKNVMDNYGTDDGGVISDFCYKVTHNIDHVCRPPDDICPVEEAIKTGRPTTVQHTHFDKEGNKIYAEVSGYPIYDNGKITEFIHISRNVTERVMTEGKLKDQRKAILELSTPVITLWKGVITLPLIGVIDSNRAKQVMENLLEAIVETQASIAIIDITGVPLVDTEVADRLVRTIKAASLLGTKCVLVGIKPDIAQGLVHLGVDLSGIETFSSLQSGLVAAFSWVGLKVVEDE